MLIPIYVFTILFVAAPLVYMIILSFLKRAETWGVINEFTLNNYISILDPVDVERAKVETPYKSTIAHGYLTLSLLPYMWNQIIQVNNLRMMVNYGMDKMKFGQAVLAGQSVRLVTHLHSLQNLRGVAKAEIKFSIEIKDQPKKALDGIATFLYYFN